MTCADTLPATFCPTRQTAFGEGRFAALDGFAIDANPYSLDGDSFARAHWRQGWRAGAALVRAQGAQPALAA